ncbi:MAG TPA: endolytic transglycosylase MltG, partial [Candidatus Saccharimonas sp.]|nr:endolytic transglycosylase MltG [Candidatus Saccharimonas sp.]
NTRKFAGLPPGPICNPGLDALNAVAHPAATDYLYFLAGKDGKTYFARTLAEHEANIAKHL